MATKFNHHFDHLDFFFEIEYQHHRNQKPMSSLSMKKSDQQDDDLFMLFRYLYSHISFEF